MMCLMDRDWARLGEHVEAERRRREWTQEDLARAADVGVSTVQSVERGNRQKPQILPTHRVIARVLGWDDGSVEAVLAGGDPTYAAEFGPSSQPTGVLEESAAALLDDLTARVKGALLGGQVVDATAVPMGDGDVVIIWKGGEEQELTPSQRRKLEQQWHRFQRAAHDILADDEEQEE